MRHLSLRHVPGPRSLAVLAIIAGTCISVTAASLTQPPTTPKNMPVVSVRTPKHTPTPSGSPEVTPTPLVPTTVHDEVTGAPKVITRTIPGPTKVVTKTITLPAPEVVNKGEDFTIYKHCLDLLIVGTWTEAEGAACNALYPEASPSPTPTPTPSESPSPEPTPTDTPKVEVTIGE